MLILALTFAAAQTSAPAVKRSQEEEIVVLGRRLEKWRGAARVKNGRYECRTKTSSGDPAVDKIACGAMSHCMSEVQPRVDALLAGSPTKKDRERLFQPINAELETCVKKAHREGLQQLAAQEEASRTE